MFLSKSEGQFSPSLPCTQKANWLSGSLPLEFGFLGAEGTTHPPCYHRDNEFLVLFLIHTGGHTYPKYSGRSLVYSQFCHPSQAEKLVTLSIFASFSTCMHTTQPEGHKDEQSQYLLSQAT